MAKKTSRGLRLRTKELLGLQEHKGRNYLLVIGIDHYILCRPLYNAVSDAKAFIKVLHDKYNFSKEDTITCFDKEATQEGIWKAFEEVEGKLGKEDNLFIYYAGHGHLNKKRDWGYWVPSDAMPGEERTYIRDRLIIDFIKGFPCRHLILISDSCFSGSFFDLSRNLTDSFTKDPSRWALTSGRKLEVLDGPIGDSSPFSTYLIKYLSENTGALLMSELGNKVKVATNAHTEMYQTPRAEPLQIKGHEGGEFIFYPRNMKEAPKEVQERAFEERHRIPDKNVDFSTSHGRNDFSIKHLLIWLLNILDWVDLEYFKNIIMKNFQKVKTAVFALLVGLILLWTVKAYYKNEKDKKKLLEIFEERVVIGCKENTKIDIEIGEIDFTASLDTMGRPKIKNLPPKIVKNVRKQLEREEKVLEAVVYYARHQSDTCSETFNLKEAWETDLEKYKNLKFISRNHKPACDCN